MDNFLHQLNLLRHRRLSSFRITDDFTIEKPEGLLVVTLAKAGGLFGLGGKKPEPVRQAVRHFSAISVDAPFAGLLIWSRVL